MSKQPVWKDALRTMVFNDNYIIYCFLNESRDRVLEEIAEIKKVEKPLSQKLAEHYEHLAFKVEFFNEEIAKLLKEIEA